MRNLEKSSGNVYTDLGYHDSTQMQIKAQLAARISEIIQQRELTQMQAAEVLGIPQPKLSGMLRGMFRGISETRMLECLNRLGQDVEIVIHPGKRPRSNGTTSVVIA